MLSYRTFESPGGQVVNGVSYIQDTTSGLFRPVRDTDLAPTIDQVNISGINIGVDQLEAINTSGVLFAANASGQLAHTYATVSNSTLSGSMSAITTGQALAANANRKQFYAQVVGSGSPLWLSYNGAASNLNWNAALKAATNSFIPDGGTLADGDYKGAVFVSGYIGCLFTIWEG